MAVYKCLICGAIYDEEKEGKPLSALDGCPVCKMPLSNMAPAEGEAKPAPTAYSHRPARQLQPLHGGDP